VTGRHRLQRQSSLDLDGLVLRLGFGDHFIKAGQRQLEQIGFVA